VNISHLKLRSEKFGDDDDDEDDNNDNNKYVRVLSLIFLMTFPVVTTHNTNVSDNTSEIAL
jgi:hypothetical protein